MKNININVYSLSELKAVNIKAFDVEVERLYTEIVDLEFEALNDDFRLGRFLKNNNIDFDITSYDEIILYANSSTDDVYNSRAIGKLYNLYNSAEKYFSDTCYGCLFLDKLKEYVFDYKYILKNSFIQVLQRACNEALSEIKESIYSVDLNYIIEYYNNNCNFNYLDCGTRIYI